LQVKPTKELKQFLAKRICKKIWNKEYFEYLVNSRNRGSKDASWVYEKDLENLKGSSSSFESTVEST
jgi:hypothetical protein